MHDDATGTRGWLHYVERSGPDGQRWASHYRHFSHLERSSAQALGRLHKGELRRAEKDLHRLRRRLGKLALPRPSIGFVLHRWYHGVRAFADYRGGHFEEADRQLSEAEAAVTRALAADPFLMPIANHCHEFQLHRARIARNRQGWGDMWRHVERARRMVGDEEPLCRPADREPVFFASLGEFFLALPGGLDPLDRKQLAGLIDPAHRTELFDSFVRSILRLPGFLIAYP